MVKIISDTSTLFSKEEGFEKDIIINPLSVTIDEQCYREFEEISSKEFLEKVSKGHIPLSSQPAFGEVVESYEACGKEEVINITMADGLSGTNEAAQIAANQANNTDKITVLNSKTLCGPHRYMVERAAMLAQSGASKAEILAMLKKLIDSSISFLVPEDFSFLKRGGRLSPLAANMMGMLKAIPVLLQSKDGKLLEKHKVYRKEKAFLEGIVEELNSRGVEANWLISISHAENTKRAEKIRDALQAAFPATDIEILTLSPSFITQGGPGCVAVQAVIQA